MKKIFAYLFVIVLFSCSKDDWEYYNPYLPDYAVNYHVNLDLPQFHQLQYGAAAVYIGGDGIGINGIITGNQGGGFVAFCAACSTHHLVKCFTLSCHCLLETSYCVYSLT